MKKTGYWLIITISILAVILLSACVQSTPTNSPASPSSATPEPTPSSRVTGTLTYLEKIALPPDAVINVKLQDISRADAPALTIGEVSIISSGKQVPFNFEIPYNSANIDPRFSYAIRATISINGQLSFTSDKTYPVITRGYPTHVDIVLKKL